MIARSMATLSAAIITILIIFIVASYRNSQTQIDSMAIYLRKNLEAKGNALVEDKGITLRLYVQDNGFDDISKIIRSNVEGDEDIVYGAYIDILEADIRLWADIPKDELAPTQEERDRIRDEIIQWAISVENPTQQFHPQAGRYDFCSPVWVEDPNNWQRGDAAPKDVIAGVVVFSLSTRNMERNVQREKAKYDRRLLQSVLLLLGLSAVTMGFAFFATERQASTITQPLGILTSAADTIATGNYNIEVAVYSGDEIEDLASSFNQMARDLSTSYQNLRLKNVQLEEARNELEDLNKHLEEKVEERTAQLRDSESKFRALFEESADAILLSDGASFIDCNPAMLKMFGCRTKKEFLELKPEQISPQRQPDGALSFKKLEAVYQVSRGGASQQFEWVNQRLDGAEFHTEIVVTSFPLNGRQVLHQVFRDITERKKIEETLRQTQLKLVETAHSAGMAEIATGVLHNIGNILNSVNISTEEIAMILKQSKVRGFLKANDMMRANLEDLPRFFNQHPKGKLIPGYYLSLGEAINDEHKLMSEEIDSLAKKVAMMRDVISTQQSYAKASLYVEDVVITDLIEDAVKLQIAALNKQGVKIKRRYYDRLTGTVPKVKLVHVLTNLIKNSKEAMARNEEFNKTQELILEIRQADMNNAEIKVIDNGCGIKPKNLDKIFNHGFTTKVNGHGFGLHTCANFMTEMGGALIADSEGEGKGSVFTVRFPLVTKEMRQASELEN